MLEPEDLQEVEQFWGREAQKCLPKDWERCFQRLGSFKAGDGTIMVGQRIENWLKQNWNQDSFTLLPGKRPFTVFYINYLHRSTPYECFSNYYILMKPSRRMY